MPMTEFCEDLTGARFEGVSLRRATFTRVRLNDASMRAVDFSGVQVRGALFRGSRMRGVELVDVDICGELQNVLVNGVDIAPLVDAELNRRMPERAKMRPDDSDGFREAWTILERLWEGTVARAGGSRKRRSTAASMTSGPSSRPCGTSTSPAPLGSAG
jgi:uncharacterized protein YjbI with pentapeptide repeats